MTRNGARFAGPAQQDQHHPCASQKIPGSIVRAGALLRGGPADQENAMVLGMDERVVGPNIAMGPTFAVDKTQYFEHPPPDPDRVAWIDALRKALTQRRQTAPVAVG